MRGPVLFWSLPPFLRCANWMPWSADHFHQILQYWFIMPNLQWLEKSPTAIQQECRKTHLFKMPRAMKFTSTPVNIFIDVLMNACIDANRTSEVNANPFEGGSLFLNSQKGNSKTRQMHCAYYFNVKTHAPWIARIISKFQSDINFWDFPGSMAGWEFTNRPPDRIISVDLSLQRI